MGCVNSPATPPPVLLACAHGTRDPRGQHAVAALVAAVRDRLPGTRVVDTWVDVQEPDLEARTAEVAEHEAVVVPLLLSAGYHVFVDMTRAVAGSPRHRVAAALGPDPRLAAVLARRLAEALDAAGAPPLTARDRVVMVAAGSSDPRAGQDCERMAQLLSAELERPVSAAYLSAAAPSLPDALAAARAEIARRGAASAPASRTRTDTPSAPLGAVPGSGDRPDDAAGRVLLAPYLLAPGYFHGRVLAAAADVAAQPLLVADGEVPPELVDLVVEHYREAAASA
ncbi:hypothetical protein CWC38_03670 [Kocuria tytonicola]|uniref:Cobalamin biosynthesis protein CbiX n=1 Tax=Kocuria tytonicola TaxID=2055946 RepID=A0A3L9L033_9MICC|nr:CbiX/SirB N-terminal domain-containing protein [Kocuria tytonicola]RLY92283.1 hypothetical protein EAE32_09045 [Kocuria tytonicola]RLZ03819.1 hypothetical protein CWC38_03670 [Kocuria tytonicola]